MGEMRIVGRRLAAILAADVAGDSRSPMIRRDFIAAAISTALLPICAHAQHPLPLVGLLLPGSPADSEQYVTACLRGMEEAGYVESDSRPSSSWWSIKKLPRRWDSYYSLLCSRMRMR
jgi:hypothetical protein